MSERQDKRYVQYWEVHEMLGWLQNQIERDGYQPHAIVGLTRGGLLPAVVLSHRLNVPMVAVSYSHPEGKGSKRYIGTTGLEVKLPVSIHQDRLLVVDDLVDSGKTLDCVRDYYVRLGYRVHTAVLIRKPSSSYIPSYEAYVAPDDKWIEFPWEITH